MATKMTREQIIEQLRIKEAKRETLLADARTLAAQIKELRKAAHVAKRAEEAQQALAMKALEDKWAKAEKSFKGKAKRLAAKHDIKIEDDSEGDDHLLLYVGKPSWIKGEDPIEDGHFAASYETLLTIVTIYAKHDPKHKDHDKREFNLNF